ncbi:MULTISPECIES: sn-glycerol-3-phosphate ABC transporter ATP-binding protein UgpC [Paraburkholderia]|uniref:Maltose/maltodextrin import ATP-binding protein MalK n=1 Tax=Paraburkholderia largidicola TaxID=3014751 RepID=A0A7I8BS18_9BURK|nr:MULTISPECIES: sn-glycerol-3-phosphate ABC transporter ATP-binding protein UgpC [Paraburkholderia]BEU25088.1 sn-glycerol-3-phosphate ABC transporter ATP-binding protein UgpC [Paraburkholderia sp. 22B1P]GJH36493.1 sn-glycerol-3-phosphate ABC transporter ATP-binding protein UgpC [Paraburkholderia hospita]CAG9245427.1 maltose ABC transporter ATP binding subunit [Paraburkholderia caribensis]BCF91293.1 maltose/maltodextrin import ATP-binding protein MalK [Paraburkholderia sp. PGU16]GJH02121.1 sn-
MSAVHLQQIRKAFAGTDVLKGVDIDVKEHEFLVFVGPSGCGKSTLLRSIAGLERIDSGRVVIEGEDVTELEPSERGVAMVFQSYALYPHMSVYENIAFGLRMIKLPEAQIKERVHRAADILQIGQLLERRPRALSGGQRQRVAIGRSIVREPKVFLFDEPLSNLDAALRVQMRLELIKLHKQLNATMIYVTHDQTEAMTMADRIVVLNHGEVEQIGSPLELYRTPRNRFVAGFIGSPKMNFLDVRVQKRDETGVTIELPGGAPLDVPCNGDAVEPGQKLVLGVRPEHLNESANSDCDSALAGEVMVIEHLGSETLLHVRLADERVIQVKGSGESSAVEGQSIKAGFSKRHVHLFRQDGMALERKQPVADAMRVN